MAAVCFLNVDFSAELLRLSSRTQPRSFRALPRGSIRGFSSPPDAGERAGQWPPRKSGRVRITAEKIPRNDEHEQRDIADRQPSSKKAGDDEVGDESEIIELAPI